MAVISIDLGGTKVAGAVVDADARVLFTHRNLLNGRTGHDVGQLVADVVKRLAQKAAYHKIDIEAVGLCVPGLVHPDNGKVWAPNIPGWENFPLRSIIHSVTGSRMPVTIENDRICYVSGEMWLGAAKNHRNVIFIAVGTGIGAGIIADGRPLQGAAGIIGATGWMALKPPYESKYDQMGCFEYYASGRGICDRARQAVRADKNYRGYLRQRAIARLTTNNVFEAYAMGDQLAVPIINRAKEMWGMGAANLISILNPEIIIWGGGVFGPAREMIDDIYAEAAKWAQPIAIKQVRFVATELGSHAGMFGAAYCAFKLIDKNLSHE